VKQLPDAALKASAKKYLQQKHNIPEEEKILFFNGTLNYKPNKDALDIILKQVNPLLLKNTDYRYKIIICGSKLPDRFNGLNAYADQRIIYAGFVEDVDTYFLGADIFINPVTVGGGIKTKLVEALAAGVSAVSTASGAIGVPLAATKTKMAIVPDGDWKSFADAIVQCDTSTATPEEFYTHFYWGNIAKKAASLLTETKVN
jgi:polysaccharide biosynthesis protein PslH